MIIINFDENYYNGDIGFKNYIDYSHFQARAQWIVDRYTENNYTRDIWIIGCGWGYVVKRVRDLLPVGKKANCKGIVFSAYEKAQSINVVGLPDGAIIQMDISDYTFPDMDIAVSWNFLDSIPPNNEAKTTGIVNKLINRATFQTHIICMDTNDPNADKFIAMGYNIKSLSYWRNKFNGVAAPSQHCILVNYYTGVNSRKIESGWTTVTGLNIPTSGDRVSR